MQRRSGTYEAGGRGEQHDAAHYGPTRFVAAIMDVDGNGAAGSLAIMTHLERGNAANISGSLEAVPKPRPPFDAEEFMLGWARHECANTVNSVPCAYPWTVLDRKYVAHEQER